MDSVLRNILYTNFKEVVGADDEKAEWEFKDSSGSTLSIMYSSTRTTLELETNEYIFVVITKMSHTDDEYHFYNIIKKLNDYSVSGVFKPFKGLYISSVDFISGKPVIFFKEK